jgi:uncharacterized protein YdeI (YjbR/CyaY-like superfamily)
VNRRWRRSAQACRSLGSRIKTAFEVWLAAQATDAPGAWLKLAKKGAEATTLTKAEAIDAALCHGWIDGQLDKYDDVHWLVRFTPRKPRSKWSEVNRTRATELVKANRMRSAGLAQINAAREDGRWKSAYAPASTAEVPPDLQLALDRNPKATAFFATLKGALSHLASNGSFAVLDGFAKPLTLLNPAPAKG